MSIMIKAVGVTFKNDNGVSRQSIISTMNEGDRVRLVEEPTNKYDPLAIAIATSDGRVVGYIGQDDPDREQIREMIGRNVFLRVIEILGREMYKPTVQGLRLAIEEDEPQAVLMPQKKHTEQKPKRKGKEYKEALVKYKRHHKERLSFHELEAIKEGRVG